MVAVTSVLSRRRKQSVLNKLQENLLTTDSCEAGTTGAHAQAVKHPFV